MFINTYSNHYQQTIDHFHGAYAFLSNFYPSRIYYRGYWYANNEAAFQAQKTISPKEQLQFTKLRNPKDAKKLGREVQLRSDWESVKLMYMYEICMSNSCRILPYVKHYLLLGIVTLLKETTGEIIFGVL